MIIVRILTTAEMKMRRSSDFMTAIINRVGLCDLTFARRTRPTTGEEFRNRSQAKSREPSTPKFGRQYDTAAILFYAIHIPNAGKTPPPD